MTSLINPNNINGAYPVAGQDNNSQGFRDNFTNTSTNFQYAADEITDLQNKVIVNAQLSGGAALSTQNNMNNGPLINALFSDFATPAVALGMLTGSVNINYASGHYQTLTLGGPVTLGFSNWPIAGQYGAVEVQFTITDPSTQHITFPAAVSVNQQIVGWNSSNNTLYFSSPVVVKFSFGSSDNGTTITISGNNKLLTPFNASNETVSTSTALSLSYTTSYINTSGGAIATTLASGVIGQIKVLAMTNFVGTMTCQVASASWQSGASGNIILSNHGQACTLLMSNGSWICIGNNSAIFN